VNILYYDHVDKMCGVAAQHHQFCFLHTHAHSHSRLYTDLRSQYSNYYYNNIQQNSINPTCMGLDKCQIMEYSELSDDTYTDKSCHRSFLLLLL
jgi:hypothetical protein